MRLLFTHAACAIFFAGAPVLAVAAQATPDEPPPTESEAKPRARPSVPTQSIDKVEVTGKQDANSLRRESSATKIIITREDIEQYGDSNLGDVMRRLPGVTQGGRPGRGGPVQMRGMAGGFTQILLNGERIPPGFSMEQITPEQVERIEILRAPTAETGARAIAGTINIILREPLRATNNDLRGGVQEDRSRDSPNLSWTRNDTFSPTGTYNFTVSLNHSDQLTDTLAHTTYLDTLTNLTNLDHLEASQTNDKRNSVFLSGRFQWRLGQAESLSVQPFAVLNNSENRSHSERKQIGGTEPTPYASTAAAADTQVRVFRVMSMLNKRFDENLRYELRLSLGQLATATNNASNQFNGAGARTLLQTVDADAKDRSWNLAGKISRGWGDGKHAFVTGAELEGIKRNENNVTLLNGNRQLADFGTELNVATRRTALYAQDEWDPSPQFGAYAGLRWEEIETRSDGIGNPVKNLSRVLSPLAQGVWRFDAPKRDQIRLALTQSYRAPTTQNLVARPSLNNLFPAPGANTAASPDRGGNPNLKPELANGIDLAYENYLKAGGVVSVNLFTRRISDLIRNVTSLETVSYATSQRFVSRPQNLGRAVTSGVEFDAKFQLTEIIDGAPALNIRANLSVFDSKVNAVKGPNNRIDQQPRATGNLGADYRFRGSPFSIGGNINFTPAYTTQQTDTQLQSLGAKRVVDFYGLWSVTSATRLRLTFSNIAPRGSTTNAVIEQGNQRESILLNGRTDMSVALRFETRL